MVGEAVPPTPVGGGAAQVFGRSALADSTTSPLQLQIVIWVGG